MSDNTKTSHFMHYNYLAMQINSAAPEKLVLIAYEGVIRFANTAKSALKDSDLEKVNDCLKRCFGIIVELAKSLQFDIWDGAANLANLYDFVSQEFLEANLAKNQPDICEQHIDAALSVVVELHKAWEEGVFTAKQAPSKGMLMEA